MSIGFCGIINLKKINTEDLINLAYLIQKEAIINKFGCKLGGNVTEEVYRLYEKYTNSNHIMFELMDSPLDNYADDIFQPTIDVEKNYEIYFNQKLKEKLVGIQNILSKIIINENVKQIFINMNYLFSNDEDKIIDITIEELCNNILKQYKENDYIAPVVKYCIRKN